MEAIQYPEFIARFYDIIYHSVRDGVDNDFFIKEITSVKGPSLEIGVGTGRFFTEALAKGADLYGIDSSRHMTDVLLSKIPEKEHYRIKTADATTMKWDKKFDIIIAPFRVFSHITDTESQIGFLNNVHDHLTKNGRFIFDVFVPDPNLLANGMKEHLDFDGEYEPGKRVQRRVSSDPDVVNQQLRVTMKLSWDENEIKKEAEWAFKMRIFFRYELELLIRLSKLKPVTIYGDYQYSPLTRTSKEFVIVCKK